MGYVIDKLSELIGFYAEHLCRGPDSLISVLTARIMPSLFA